MAGRYDSRIRNEQDLGGVELAGQLTKAFQAVHAKDKTGSRMMIEGGEGRELRQRLGHSHAYFFFLIRRFTRRFLQSASLSPNRWISVYTKTRTCFLHAADPMRFS